MVSPSTVAEYSIHYICAVFSYVVYLRLVCRQIEYMSIQNLDLLCAYVYIYIHIF